MFEDALAAGSGHVTAPRPPTSSTSAGIIRAHRLAAADFALALMATPAGRAQPGTAADGTDPEALGGQA